MLHPAPKRFLAADLASLSYQPYLGRRAIENKSVLESPTGAKYEAERAVRELKRRVFGASV